MMKASLCISEIQLIFTGPCEGQILTSFVINSGRVASWLRLFFFPLTMVEKNSIYTDR